MLAGEEHGTSRADGKEQPAASFSEVCELLTPSLVAPGCVPGMGADRSALLLQGGSAESTVQACRIHVLFLILHSGNILDQGGGELGSKQADVQTLAATFDAVTRVHFPEALGHVALRLVPCPPICAAAYALVSK